MSRSEPFLQLAPVVIGVTGHRDLPAEDIPQLQGAVNTVLLAIQEQSPNSPHILLSALAEGGDRVVAHSAINLGWKLGAILPASPELYGEDFSTLESRNEYRDLLSKATWVETLPCIATGPTAYQAANLRIARQSLYLIALWDGIPGDGDGGTEDMVSMFRYGIPEPEMPGLPDNSLPDARPVIHIKTRRMKDTGQVQVADVGSIEELPPEPARIPGGEEKLRWDRILHRIDDFNADTLACVNAYGTDAFAPRLETIHAEHEQLPPAAQSAAHLFAIADTMSNQAQTQRNRQMYWLFGLTLVAIFCEQVYSGPIWSPGWLAGAIITVVIAALVFSRGGRARLEARYLDYRSMAEACRVQYFWKRTGLSATVADHYLRDQRDELEWLRQVLRNTELRTHTATPTADRYEFAARDWIDDQRRWFIGDGTVSGGKAGWNADRAKHWSGRISLLFRAGIVVTLILLLLHVFVAQEIGRSDENALQWTIVIYGVLFGLAGMAAAYLEIKAFAEQSRNYRRMGLAMEMARHHLDTALEAGNHTAADNVLLGAGRDALTENGNWLLLHRDRPAHVPLG